MRRGFTLVEIMMVVVILGILGALAIPAFEPNVAAQIEATARIVTADLGHIRQLAVTNNGKYRLTFEIAENRFYWEHSGTNSALAALPSTIYAHPSNTAVRQYVDLDELPQLGPGVFLSRVTTAGAAPTIVTALEFGPLGATTEAADTVIWLACGAGAEQRFMSIHVNAVTGLAQVGDLDSTGPAGSGS